MAVHAARVDVDDSSPTPVYTAGVAGAHVTVRNGEGASVFLGPSTVTDTNGFELGASASVELNMNPGDVLYGIVATGTKTVHVIAS